MPDKYKKVIMNTPTLWPLVCRIQELEQALLDALQDLRNLIDHNQQTQEKLIEAESLLYLHFEAKRMVLTVLSTMAKGSV
jgi:hypothetical protein